MCVLQPLQLQSSRGQREAAATMSDTPNIADQQVAYDISGMGQLLEQVWRH